MDFSKDDILRILHYLISHHSEEYYNRTIRIRIRGKNLHICARCTGITSSFLISAIVVFFLRIFLGFFINPYIALIISVILLIPTMVDWATQKLEFRESTNKIRIGLGILLGIGFTLLQFAIVLSVLTTSVVLITLIIFFGVIIYRDHVRYKIPKSST
jgi:uncharacterized membrane protein